MSFIATSPSAAAVPLPLHEFHQHLGARFGEVNGVEIVADYGDVPAEYQALRQSAGVWDLSFRSRLCLVGADRARFLHGQVTNDIKRLRAGEGCYAALTTAKGKMQSDLNVFCLADELLLDFEPGLGVAVTQRLEKFIVADDVQVVDVAGIYGLLAVQGPESGRVVQALGIFKDLPVKAFDSLHVSESMLGELYLMNHARWGGAGFDLFVPVAALGAVADKAIAAARAIGGRPCGWQAAEIARIEAGIPRFGMDMDETNFPAECGIEAKAMSYSKGCYIGQEVLNRIHSFGHVNRELRGLRLPNDLMELPPKGAKLFQGGKDAGYVTSAIKSPTLDANVALAIVRREANEPGTQLQLQTGAGEITAVVAALPLI